MINLEMLKDVDYYNIGVFCKISNMANEKNIIKFDGNYSNIKSFDKLRESIGVSGRKWRVISKLIRERNLIQKINISSKITYLIINPELYMSKNFCLDGLVYSLYKKYFIENIYKLSYIIDTDKKYNIIKNDIEHMDNLEIKKLRFKFSPNKEYDIFNGEYNGYGVYALYHNEKVVYIGKSKNIKNRIVSHKKDKIFDFVKSIIFKDENLVNLYEPYLIQKYQPKYNNDLLERFEFELPEIKL